MPERGYWLDLFSYKTWTEFLKAGGDVSGFRESRWSSVQRMKPGDYLLCYMTGISRWIGILEVTGKPFQDSKPIWSDAVFPARVPVKVITALKPETGVPVVELKHEISAFKNLKNPNAWTGRFRGSPAKWSKEDGVAVTRAILQAEKDPKVRPIDQARLSRKPPILVATDDDAVIIPIDDGASPEVPAPNDKRDASAHTEVQWLLLKLGSDIGLDVWVARNDRSRDFKGRKFSGLRGLREELPRQFDQATNRTIELIDVLWLDGDAFVAAFEIESTTSIYSGLLRMADLVSMQPNLSIPLYLVAPEARQDKVITEVNRPTFSKLHTPLKEICQFISFEKLRNTMTQIEPFVRRMKPDLLDDIAESCDIGEQ